VARRSRTFCVDGDTRFAASFGTGQKTPDRAQDLSIMGLKGARRSLDTRARRLL
jgi:hypothetical protein